MNHDYILWGLWSWLASGLLAYITGIVFDSILHQRKFMVEGVDIAILLLSIIMGPITWLLVFTSIYNGFKKRKALQHGKRKE